MTPEQRQRAELVSDYSSAPRLLEDVVFDAMAVCNDEKDVVLHDKATGIINNLVGLGRDDFVARVAKVVLEVARNEIIKENNEG